MGPLPRRGDVGARLGRRVGRGDSPRTAADHCDLGKEILLVVVAT